MIVHPVRAKTPAQAMSPLWCLAVNRRLLWEAAAWRKLGLCPISVTNLRQQR